MLLFCKVFFFVFLTGWFCVWWGGLPPDVLLLVWLTALVAGGWAAGIDS